MIILVQGPSECSFIFLSFFTDQDVPPATKGYIPELDCLWPGFVVIGNSRVQYNDAFSVWAGLALTHPEYGISVNHIPTK